MDKQFLIDQIAKAIQSDLAQTTEAALESAQSATDDDSRSEGKYDTRGLETSYLATGQALHARELQESLASMQRLESKHFGSGEPISLGALVATLSSVGREVFFMAPAQGGLEIEQDGQAILVVTPRSPLGAALLGRRVGSKVELGGRTVVRIS